MFFVCMKESFTPDRKLLVTEMDRVSVSEYRNQALFPLAVLLDNVRSTHNVGAVFRTCDAFRVEAVNLCGIAPQPPHPLIHKTALGAEDAVPFCYWKTPLECVEHYRNLGYEIWCLEQTVASMPLESCALDNRKVLLVAGNEVHGVSDEVVACANQCIEIPQFGSKHSLNISVSVGIALYHLLAPCFGFLKR